MATADKSSSLTTSSIAQSLPPYIISEILKHFSAPLILHQITQYPWYLAHICSSWRIEFLTMRRNFWNEIRVHVRYSRTGMKEIHQRIIEVVTMFLGRHRGHPFSFELDINSDIPRKCTHSLTIFNLFISEAPRWQRVTLKIRGIDVARFHCVKGQLEHLESLDFFCFDAKVILPPATLTDHFMIAPCLTRLCLHGLARWDFNWSMMTFMDLSCDEIKEVARLPSILSQAVQLETLVLYFDDESLPSIITPIVFPSLLSLTTDSFSLIQAITTPSLRALFVDLGLVMTQYDAESSDILKSFFGRSRCQLQTVKLVNLAAAPVMDILSHTPDIRTLYLAYAVDYVADIFEWLNGIRPVDNPNLTCLQTLGMYNCTPPHQDQMYKILNFVAMRTEALAVEKLQKLDIKWYWHQDQEASEALEEQLRRMCELYDIQYSNECDAYEVVEDVHGHSLDTCLYSILD